MRKQDGQCCISIIVPLYRGKHYVNTILQQIEKNALYVNQVSIQVILYNDFPEEVITVDSRLFTFEILVINSPINRGIHGARVAALKNAKGIFVLFLDQDDIIGDCYIESQLSKIGDADAIVCRLLHGDRQHYTDTFKFEEVITKKFMLSCWCPIVSPGQVIIRKAAIPSVWKKEILKNNGADDYFLWLCMMAEGKKFVLNQEILFRHMLTGTNTSANINMMMDSELEMIQILLDKHVFTLHDEQILRKLPHSLRQVHINELDNFRVSFTLYDFWINGMLNEIKQFYFLEKRNSKIAIYGAGEIGKSVYKILNINGYQNIFFIDRNAEYICSKIPIYRIENSPKEIDAIVIALIRSVDLVIRSLTAKFNCPIYQVKELYAGNDHID